MFALKFTNLVIKFQITGPLYYADSFPTLYSTLGISICNSPLRDGLLTNFKLKGGYKTLSYKISCIRRRSLLLYV